MTQKPRSPTESDDKDVTELKDIVRGSVSLAGMSAAEPTQGKLAEILLRKALRGYKSSDLRTILCKIANSR